MNHEPNDFYVGYLPMPPAYKRALTAFCCVLAFTVLASAVSLAISHREGGDGLWDTGHEVVLEGALVASPYPYLLLEDGTTAFLVEVGKKGSQARVGTPPANSVAKCRGWAITRDGRRILELAPEPDAVAHEVKPANFAPPPVDRGEVTLSGEIVDYKCYLGAMKPGDGKGHKACATLCIGNGIPPVLVTTTNGTTEYLVLTDETGRRPVSQLAAPFAGEPVVVTGQRMEQGATSWLLVRSISRRDP